MECFNHPGTQAAGTCSKCGKGLCASCIERFGSPICEQCLRAECAALKIKYCVELSITAIIFVGILVLFLFFESKNIEAGLFFAFFVTAAYWGRSAFVDPKNVKMDAPGYGLGKILQLFIAVIFGFIIMPFAIFKRIKEIIKINRLLKMQNI